MKYNIIREKGYAFHKEVDTIVLETDGSLTVIRDVLELQTASWKGLLKSDDIY